MHNLLPIAGDTCSLTVLRQGQDPPARLEAEETAICQLFTKREKEEFPFCSSIIAEYLHIESLVDSPFLQDPTTYIQQRCLHHLQESGKNINCIVIWTAYGDKLAPHLDGYNVQNIIMPAGPANTIAFSKKLSLTPSHAEAYTLYLEAENESEKKPSTLVLSLTDSTGSVCGGVCVFASECAGGRFAYISTLVVRKNMPPLTGSYLLEETIKHLRSDGVAVVNLETQTAAHFYENHGFIVTQRIIQNLRMRTSSKGQSVGSDMVIMEKKL